MKKHSLSMVFLLILLLSLVSAVSASDSQVIGDAGDVFESQGEIEMDLKTDYETHEEVLELSNQYDDSLDSPIYADNPTKSLDANYKLGYEITTDFIDNHNIECMDDVLVITNAGYSKINDQTTEDVLNGIIDASNGYITYEDGNLVKVSSNVDSMFVSFFCKNDESLTIALYKDSTAPLYYGNAGPEMSASQLECLMLNDDDLNSCLCILDSWTNGSLDDLNLRAYLKYVSFGLLGECDTLTAKNYPHEFNLPLGGILGVSRDFDDDAFILEKSNSSDEKASFDVNMVGKSMGESSSLNLYDVGVDATDKALNYLKSHVDILKDYPYLYVLTSAGQVKVNGQKTTKVLDGILDTLGSKFDKKHLISVDDPSWKDLVFYFIMVKDTKHISYALKYDSTSAKLVESNQVEKLGTEKARKLGLYSDGYKRNYGFKSIVHKSVSEPLVKNSNKTDKVNTGNKTNHSNVTVKNSSDNVSNVSKNVKKSKDFAVPSNHGSPYNILYTFVAVLIVCVIFGNGYRKR